MPKTRHLTIADLLTGVLQGLHPRQANRWPALFILEITASFLSVLTLHDEISGGRGVSVEASSAVGLWATLLAVLFARTLQVHSIPILFRGKKMKSPPG